MFAGGDRDRLLGAYGGVREDVVGAGGLLDPVRVVRCQGLHPVDGLGHVPALVGVHGDPDVGADRLAGQPHPAQVVVQVAADLELDLPEARGDGLLGQPGQLLVGVAEPAGLGGVGGVAAGAQQRGALGPAGLGAAQDLQRLVTGEGVAEVAEVDQVDQFLGGHTGQQFPDRAAARRAARSQAALTTALGRHVHHALLRAQPAQLGVVGEQPVEGAEITGHTVHPAPDDIGSEGPDRGGDDVVAAADREAEAVPRQVAGRIRTEYDIGGGVVGVGIHGVRAVELLRGRKADVVDLDLGDGRTHAHSRRKTSDLFSMVRCIAAKPAVRPGGSQNFVDYRSDVSTVSTVSPCGAPADPAVDPTRGDRRDRAVPAGRAGGRGGAAGGVRGQSRRRRAQPGARRGLARPRLGRRPRHRRRPGPTAGPGAGHRYPRPVCARGPAGARRQPRPRALPDRRALRRRCAPGAARGPRPGVAG